MNKVKVIIAVLLALFVLSQFYAPSDTVSEPVAAASLDPSVIRVAELPVEARQTLQLIYQGGPFPYDRDGIVFGNREGLLPKQSRGYYREYTVLTPNIKGRGARRIVCGVVPECYYTVDHYNSFKQIRE